MRIWSRINKIFDFEFLIKRLWVIIWKNKKKINGYICFKLVCLLVCFDSFVNRNVGFVMRIILVKYSNVVSVLNKFYVFFSIKCVSILVNMGEENMMMVVFVNGMCWKV